MSGSVGTLRKLARFYKTNILDFFDANGASSRQVRPAERKVLEAGAGVRMELLAWGNTVMEPHLFRIAPDAGSGDPYTHEGEEFIYVLRGDLEITVEGESIPPETWRQLLFRKRDAASLEKSGPQRNLGVVDEYSADVLNSGPVFCRLRIGGKMNWQRALRLLPLLALFLSVVSCSKKTPTLNLLVWEGYADPSFVKAFEEQNHCKVSASYMGSSDELVAKLRGGSAGNYDVISPSSDVASSIATAGLAAPLDLSKIPSLQPTLRADSLPCRWCAPTARCTAFLSCGAPIPSFTTRLPSRSLRIPGT